MCNIVPVEFTNVNRSTLSFQRNILFYSNQSNVFLSWFLCLYTDVLVTVPIRHREQFRNWEFLAFRRPPDITGPQASLVSNGQAAHQPTKMSLVTVVSVGQLTGPCSAITCIPINEDHPRSCWLYLQ